jgi:hypothetical protein
LVQVGTGGAGVKLFECDFCKRQTPGVQDMFVEGWYHLSQAEGNHSGIFGPTAGYRQIGMFCSLSCLVRFAELKAIEVAEPEEPEKKGWRK